MRRGALCLAISGAACAVTTVAFAQPDGLPAQQRRLVEAKQASADAALRSGALDRQAARENDAAARARVQEAALAARIEGAQADIAAAQSRVAIVAAALRSQRAVLATRSAPVARLLAALEGLARRPPVVALVQPGSVSDIVHVRAVLATVTPYVARRTAAVRADLARTDLLRRDAGIASQSLIAGRARLDAQRLALARLEEAHRGRSTRFSRAALAESDRAIGLGERARDLVDAMQLSRDQTTTVGALLGLPAPPLRPGDFSAVGADAPWAAAAAPYRLPAAGEVVTGLGELAPSGFSARGLTLAVAPRAVLVAPADGTVAYAGRFLDYGAVVILDHGGGWTTLLTGFDRLAVRKGATVAQGRPLGIAPAGSAPRVTVELRRKGRPIDLTGLLG